MKLLTTLALSASLLFSNVVQAENVSTFYQNRSKNWYVEGRNKVDQRNPVCLVSYTWRDGSEFVMYRDLADGELYAVFQNNSWNITDDINNIYRFRLNVYVDNDVRGLNGEYELLSKSTIRIRGIEQGFMNIFAEATAFRFIMGGTIPNAELKLEGSGAAAQMMNQCIKQYKNSLI